MIRVGIIGVSGYSGGEVLRLLLNHKNVRVTYVSANNTQGKIKNIWPDLNGKTDLICKKFNLSEATLKCDLLFLAVPHTASMAITPELLKAGKKVIDLSADYRLKNTEEYAKWYETKHKDTHNLKKAVYGLSELFRMDIKKTKLVANPGCYPTAAILGLAPIVSTYPKSIEDIIVDAKSGVSGAGRKVVLSLMFSEVNENFKAYKVLKHQHAPEINQCLSKIAQKEINVTFVAHLLPINRGILETIYIKFKKLPEINSIHEFYKKFYKTDKFVRVMDPDVQPEIKNVTYTNYCDIGLALDKEKKILIVTSVIDNLVKGAAGQAIQNMNIMSNFNEEEGLI